MQLSQVIYSKEEGIAIITLNRPEAMNALTPTMVDELLLVLDDAKRDPGVKVAVITGAGRAFCSGADVKGMASDRVDDPRRTGPSSTSAAEARNRGNLGIQRVPRAVEAFPKPLLASVNGPAVGGGMDLASMCDWRIASERARFGITHVRVARLSADGGYYFLSRIIGAAKTLELAWTNRIFDAQEALRIGYINKLVPHEELGGETRAFASMLARGPSVAIELAKRLICRAPNSSLDQALKDVELASAISTSTEDAIEAPRALVEKREPAFKGR